jgi:hypothetical protein
MRTVTLLLCLVPSIAAAQVPTLAVGSRLRVYQPAVSRIEGTLMAQTADSLTVASVRATRALIPSARVGRIQVSEGEKASAGALKGAKIGGVLGLAGGLFLAALASDLDSGFRGEDFAVLSVAGMFNGALYGAVIGAVVGAEKWTTVYRSGVR